MLRLITHFGDSAVLIPAALVVGCYLLASSARRVAFAWGVAILGAMAATLVAKIGFYIVSCGARGPMDILSPSGHTSFSVAFYGGVAILVGNGRPPAQRGLVILGGLLFALVIGLTRILIHVHTVSEVVVGCVIGGTAMLVFAKLYERAGRPEVKPLPLLAVVLASAVLLHGVLLDAEPVIRHIAGMLRLTIGVCG